MSVNQASNTSSRRAADLDFIRRTCSYLQIFFVLSAFAVGLCPMLPFLSTALMTTGHFMINALSMSASFIFYAFSISLAIIIYVIWILAQIIQNYKNLFIELAKLASLIFIYRACASSVDNLFFNYFGLRRNIKNIYILPVVTVAYLFAINLISIVFGGKFHTNFIHHFLFVFEFNYLVWLAALPFWFAIICQAFGFKTLRSMWTRCSGLTQDSLEQE
jgi:hypothetical protein